MSIHGFSKGDYLSGFKSLDKNRDIKSLKREEASDKPFFASKIANLFIVPAAAFLDGSVLFNILDEALLQSARMGIIMTIGVAVILNFLPLFIARFALEVKYRLNTLAKPLLVLTTTMFVLIYSSTVFLRVAYSNLLSNTDEDNLRLTNYVSSQETIDSNKTEESDSDNIEKQAKSLAVTILLCLSPLMTSGISFCIALVGSDPVRNRMYKHRREVLRIQRDNEELSAMLAGMSFDISEALEADNEALKAAIESAYAREMVMKSYARWKHAMHMGDPDATSRMADDMKNYETDLERQMVVAEAV